MQKFVVLTLCSWVALLGAGCGKHNPAEPTQAAKPAIGPKDAEIEVTMLDNVQVVEITADDTMHFNGNRFTVHTGQPVRVNLTNKGTRPATEMAHDFVLLKAGADAFTFNLLCAQAKDQQYFPAQAADKTLTHTSLAEAGKSVSASFQAPEPGQYPFLCTFPGHYAAGMYGTMTVVP